MHHQLLRAHAGITNFEEVGAADRLTADGIVFLKHKAFFATQIEYCGPDKTILYGSKRLEVEFMYTHVFTERLSVYFPMCFIAKKIPGQHTVPEGQTATPEIGTQARF